MALLLVDGGRTSLVRVDGLETLAPIPEATITVTPDDLRRANDWYYRAAFWHSRPLFGPPQIISVPTLLIWGERDLYLSNRLTRGLNRWVSDLRIVRLPTASHWVQNDSPEAVNNLLIAFFAEAILNQASDQQVTR